MGHRELETLPNMWRKTTSDKHVPSYFLLARLADLSRAEVNHINQQDTPNATVTTRLLLVNCALCSLTRR